MKTLEIEIPKGHIIDKEKSTFERIVFKEKRYPESVSEINTLDSVFYISDAGNIESTDYSTKMDVNDFTSRQEAEAMLAFMQLRTLCLEWNRIDGFGPDWNSRSVYKYCLYTDSSGSVRVTESLIGHCPLYFRIEKTASLFKDTFKDILETAKNLI